MTYEHALSDAKRRILKQIHDILQRGYTCEFKREDDGSWSARVVEFEGCMAVGQTREDAEEVLGDRALFWLIVALGRGDAIPQPGAAA